jgi:broad specificity phosphatase PhoE
MAQAGDIALLEELRDRPAEEAPLTGVGMEQMVHLREWLRKEQFVFDRKYVSPLRRTKQSSRVLKLGRNWVESEYLTEQSLGIMRYMTPGGRQEYLDSLRGEPHIRDPYNFAPVDGESFAYLATNRVVPFLEDLERDCSGNENVFVMGHSGTNKMIDCCIRQWTPKEFVAHYVHGDNKILNGMVQHYTRIDPATGEESETLDWVRTCCPWVDPEPTEWQKIERGSQSPAWLSFIRELLALPAA